MKTPATSHVRPQGAHVADIKQVPQDARVRLAIRDNARQWAARLDTPSSHSRERLQAEAASLLDQLRLPCEFLGFAMVALDNAVWADRFEAVPTHRRLLLLPKCLSSSTACQGTYDSVGLHCADCGACIIPQLSRQAAALGYEVVVAEGTSSVVMKVLDGQADAILGVACLDSLEKSFERIADLGIPHQAIPLLADGCKDTQVEADLVRSLLTAQGPAPGGSWHTYLPLLRASRAIFDPSALDETLAGQTGWHSAPRAHQSTGATHSIARDWLLAGGKRFRPFVTLSAYAVGRHGAGALDANANVDSLVPPAVRRLAVAIEAMHKASLVHDDIEDSDLFRYGKPTLHRTYGVGAAINVGDYLVGLGYRLIAAQVAELGAERVADILARLSTAHLQLCSGQGAELMYSRDKADGLRPVHALQIGALKTAPAFEVALYAGLRASGAAVDDASLRQFATLIGEGYQVLNDLTDWEQDAQNKVSLGQDVLSGRPTILRAFACEAGRGDDLARLAGDSRDDPKTIIAQVQQLYEELGVFAKAETLYDKLRKRALDIAAAMGDADLQRLLTFLVRNVLRRRAPRDSGEPD